MAEFDSVIRPGGTGHVTTTVKTANIQGERRKTITLDTNDPDRPVVVLHVRFESIPPIAVLPTTSVSLDVTEGRGKKGAGRTLVLRRDDGELLELSVARNPFPGLDVAIERYSEGIDAGGVPARPGDVILRLVWTGISGPDFERSQLELATNHPAEPTLSVPIQVRFRTLFQARPSALRMEVRAPAYEGIARTTIHHGRRRPFRIESIRIVGLDGVVSAKALSDEPLVAHAVELRVAPNALPAGVHEGVLEIVPKANAERIVRVPLSVSVTAASEP